MSEKTTDKDEVYTGPKGSDGPPPSHAETLGALPTAPKAVAEEYARTGRTPKSYVDKVLVNPEDAERKGVPANAGTAGQAPYPEDQAAAAKEQQRDAAKAQKDAEAADHAKRGGNR